MKRILLIETAADSCSAAISEGADIIASRFVGEPRQQASMLAVIIRECLQEASMTINDCAAVAVSSGPGSYTGLRVGVSTAKGLCFGSGIPLIGIDTLEIIAQGAINSCRPAPDALVVPMLDARRMEVFTAGFSSSCEKISDTRAMILDETSFTDEFKKYSSVIFAGDGAPKFMDILTSRGISNAVMSQNRLCAMDMALPALRAFEAGRFEDVAYFEPFYLKEYIAASPSKKIEAVLGMK